MRLLASRELAARPGKVWKDLAREGALVITKYGKPLGIITPTSDQTLLEDMQDLIFARSRRAVSALRRDAALRPSNSQTEVDREIKATRSYG
jgi:hypothetical protein